jgi:hypothetical protein
MDGHEQEARDLVQTVDDEIELATKAAHKNEK